MSDIICTVLLGAALIIVFTAIIGRKTESSECSDCLEKLHRNEGNCIRCNKHILNRSIFKTFKEVWKWDR